jgi:2-phosphosulfolactate phosphatase
MDLPDRLVLPSPNGSALTVAAQEVGVRHVLAGCVRNASATAQRAAALAGGGPIAVIAAGEVSDDGSLRPAIEDLLGAGAVISARADRMPSPEARVAAGTFEATRATLGELIGDCASARELTAVGFADDVAMATDLDVCHVAAELRSGAYVAVERP